MKITLLSEERIRFEGTAGPMSVEAESPDQMYSPFHMVAGGLAFCVYSVLHSWAGHAELSADDLAIEVEWEFAEKPHRVGKYTLDLLWPSLPEGRRNAAVRASHLCPIHQTLQNAPEIETRLEGAA